MTGEKSVLAQGLELWRQITGIDPEAQSMSMGDWSLRQTFDELKEAIALDPTEVTGNLLLAFFLNEYLEARAVNMLELLSDPQGVLERLKGPQELLALMNSDEVVHAREDFVSGLRIALDRYDASERQDVQELLETPDMVAVLRRDALRSIANLRVDQFLDGEPVADDVRPVYNLTVHQWWNVNSMLAAATRMPSGVSLNLIRHPAALQSYFCFTIRNGANLFVLSDVPEDAHPLQGGMRRRPDREFSRRASRNWFPYDLVDVEISEDGKTLYEKKVSEARGLVAYQNVALPLEPIANLPPENLVWVSMMFDLILEKFWRRGFKAKRLSYTAEMLRSDAVLLESARTSGLPLAKYKPIGLPALTRADVTTDASTEKEIGRKYHQPNRWMEERYGNRVRDEVLNVVGAPEQVFVLEAQGGVVALKENFYEMSNFAQGKLLEEVQKLERVDATSFGSKTQIAADRKFIARVNFARSISTLAAEEFKDREREVCSWYQERVQANLPALAAWVTSRELWVDDGMSSSFSGHKKNVGGTKKRKSASKDFGAEERLLRRIFKLYDRSSGNLPWYSGLIVGRKNEYDGPMCFETGTKPSYLATFFPGNPQELALFAGCSVDELPDVLQAWTLIDPYAGNRILDRIDPMIWCAKNPWLDLNLQVRFGVSKRTLTKLEKQPVQKPPLATLIEVDPELDVNIAQL